ncbi:hypothetical protein [Kitasatospora fiedleri]|uniref:hypothetical protein n=1 Tax=Kitasatospora fiedleri TaxID=2991545 RepID=UPI00249B7680|nr:hypothetical protein [Kitasatospora fiedleri]
MRYLHAIESTETAANPTWQTIILADAAEDHDGTAADYGRNVLDRWTYDNDAQAVDTDGRPLLRVIVWNADESDAPAATVTATDLA